MQERNTSPPGGLTARSVVASTLLGTEPPVLPGKVLVRVAELFGISEGTTRTALSRMVAGDELSAVDGSYRLTGRRHLERQARQAASRSADRRIWRGTWLMAIVVLDRRQAPDRADLRAALESLPMAELREGVWLRPDNLHRVWPDVVRAQCTVMSARDVDGALVDRLWDLPGWAKQAQELRRDIGELVDPLAPGDTSVLADGFVVSARVLRHFQGDPLMPDQLLPNDWPGAVLRDEYETFDTAYRALLRKYLRAVH